jgi:hypothetical protein
VALFEPLFDALNRADVRYVVVGDVAVVLHGFARLTGDVDLAIDLRPPETRKAVHALTARGLRPRLPVDAMQFADPVMRGSTFIDPDNPMLLVDCFAQDVIPFEELWTHSEVMALASTSVSSSSIEPTDRRTSRTSWPWRRFAGGGHGMADSDAGWEGTRRFQFERALGASSAQRLEWLEQAIELAYRAGALPRCRDKAD